MGRAARRDRVNGRAKAARVVHRSPQPRTGSTTKLLKGGMPSCPPFLGKKRRDIGAGIVEGGLSTYSSWLLYKPGISHAGVFAVADVDDIDGPRPTERWSLLGSPSAQHG